MAHPLRPFVVAAVVAAGILAFGRGITPPGGVVAASQTGCAEQAAALEATLGMERGAQLTGGGEGLPVEQITATLRACWREYEAQMPAAEEECALYKQLVPKVLSWSRQVSLLGLDGEFAAEQERVMPWVVRGLTNCFDEAFDTCVDEHDPTQVVEMRSIQRQLALLGAEGAVDASKYEKCLRFELYFESTVAEESTTGGTGDHRIHVRARVPLRTEGLAPASGEGALEYVAYTAGWKGDDCRITIDSFRTTAPFRVLSFDYDVAARDGGAREITEIALAYDPGATQENVTARCGNATAMHTFSIFTLLYEFLHEEDRSAGAYTVRDWTRGGGAVLARRTYQRSRSWADGLVTRTEDTSFELRHTPVR